MNPDTLPTAQLERGFRTLAHDWRNVLNGINLRIMSAAIAEKPEDADSDLKDVSKLIGDASKTLASLTRKLLPPSVAPIPYPTTHLVEDLQVSAGQLFGTQMARCEWQVIPGSGKALVDYDAFCNAFCELFGNSLRYLPEGSVLTIETRETPEAFHIDLREEKHGGVLSEGWGETPFYSTEKERLGLGIYYANRVLKALGGSLAFEYSVSEKLLRTRLQLPLARP